MSENFAEQLSKLPHLLSQHVLISVVALAAGMLISLPLAVLVAKNRVLRGPVLAAVGVIQTIPSLALLALMVPLFSVLSQGLGMLLSGAELSAFGFWPAVVALTLYSMLPIVRNTVTGIAGVSPAMTEAARALGMTRVQMLFKVELPLAAPVIIAGLRTATVWVVGIATLATPVGQPCLGNYIFSGLHTRNWTAVLFGCVAAAVLAIVLDQLIALGESASQSHSKGRGGAAAAGLALVIALALAPAAMSRSRTNFIRVGAKTFTEQYILASLITSQLQDAGLPARKIQSLGSTIVFDALANGQIDVYVDYSGTIWANYMKRRTTPDAPTVMRDMTTWLRDEHGITNVGALGFENAYALAMRRDRAEALGIKTISDLVAHAPQMKIGSDYEFFNRPEWIALRDTYGLKFDRTVSFDSTFMYQAVADGDVDVITAFSSDGRIAAFDLVVLADPQGAFPPYDAVMLVGPDAANNTALTHALTPLLGAIDVDLMRQANQRVDIDGWTVEQAANWLKEQIGKAAHVEAQSDDEQ